ncbi:MAG: BrnT family toxin [Thiobacillus sp.]|nr:BrnT family toxin [Thiobacillus sp.]MDP1923886.1 BrnT family toxin [Thiobacillus sp.]MDP3126555.1 BrnT family toxin [Thiobacillus sp.]
MHIEFDPTKDLANQDKHGVSLALAVELDWEAALVWVDERIEYGEARMIALAPKTGILYTWPLLIVAGQDASSACAAPIVVR